MSDAAVTLYGIPNCDTVRKARAWLNAHGVSHEFHDFKKAGVSAALVSGWVGSVGWELLVNRKGTTWRGLPEARKSNASDATAAIALMLEMPSVIKRPVLAVGNQLHVGFDETRYQSLFLHST